MALYRKKIHWILTKTRLFGETFHTQTEQEISNFFRCNLVLEKNIGIMITTNIIEKREAGLPKNIHYIQIKDKGLFHLGNDVCGFGVPMFDFYGGKCQNSSFSLDNKQKLPVSLSYHP